MLLKKVECIHFKNYASIGLNFSAQLNFIVGENGAGKTNLLDAIHYLSLTKSAFNLVDAQNIRHGEDFCSVQGDFLKERKGYSIQCIFQKNTKKVVKNNGKAYEKLSDHIGLFPIVLITPDDKDVIKEGNEIRRKFFDSILCQLDSSYLQTLIQYNHILKQRNSLLKAHTERGVLDHDLLTAYNHQLFPLGKKIGEARKKFTEVFHTSFIRHYQYIVEANERVHLTYKSEVVDPNFEQHFLDNLPQDLLLQRTTMGIHRDDFVFTINGYPLKKLGSQGQQKSFVIAMKLAQFDCINNAMKLKPLLLLDDIFDKLDEKRINRLVQLIAQYNFGQVFITEAREQRTLKMMEEVEADKKIFRIEKGKLVT
ncbi:MAG: DNA replication and repair protein RecF [Cytophagales bacterium]|nr:DNA replication and repair protein RecF [Cytophagales bacterium]